MEAGLQVGGVAVGNITTGGVTANADCACCDDGPPPPTGTVCCLPGEGQPQGRPWMVCFRSLSIKSDVDVASGCGSSTSSRHLTLDGNSFAFHSRIPLHDLAAGEIPVRLDEESRFVSYVIPGTTNPTCPACGPDAERVEDTFRRTTFMCLPVTFYCPPESTGSNEEMPPYVVFGGPFAPLPIQIPGYPLAPGDVFGSADYDASTSIQYQPPPPTPPLALVCPAIGNETVTNAWSVGQRCSYQSSKTVTESGSYAFCCATGPGQFCTPSNTFCIEYSSTEIITAQIGWVVRALEDCDGNEQSPCRGEVSPCDIPAQSYLIATPCPGTPMNAPQVVFPAANVTACGVVRDGNFCHTISPESSKFISATVPPNTYFDIVDDAWPIKTCCECQPGCPKTDIAPRPCWMNARRINGEFVTSGDRPDLVSPPLVSGTCCCRADDIITFGVASSDYVQLNLIDPVPNPNDPNQPYEEHWRLCPAPISFRRDAVDPMAGQSCPTLPVSSPGSEPGVVFAFRTGWDGRTIGQFAWTNGLAPYGECEWERMGVSVDFGNPQNAIGFYNNGFGFLLPCPNDPGGQLGDWRIAQWNISVTCQHFSLDASFEQIDGQGQVVATLRNRLNFQIARGSEANGQPCTGGCVGGASGSFVVRKPEMLAKMGSGCGNCGNKGL